MAWLRGPEKVNNAPRCVRKSRLSQELTGAGKHGNMGSMAHLIDELALASEIFFGPPCEHREFQSNHADFPVLRHIAVGVPLYDINFSSSWELWAVFRIKKIEGKTVTAHQK